MTYTPFETGLALVLLIVAAVLVILYHRYRAARSERRMMGMLQRAGVDPEFVRQQDTEAIIREIRRRCRKCQSEDMCEKWLSGEVSGPNSFCPNREVFRELAKKKAA